MDVCPLWRCENCGGLAVVEVLYRIQDGHITVIGLPHDAAGCVVATSPCCGCGPGTTGVFRLALE